MNTRLIYKLMVGIGYPIIYLLIKFYTDFCHLTITLYCEKIQNMVSYFTPTYTLYIKETKVQSYRRKQKNKYRNTETLVHLR